MPGLGPMDDAPVSMEATPSEIGLGVPAPVTGWLLKKRPNNAWLGMQRRYITIAKAQFHYSAVEVAVDENLEPDAKGLIDLFSNECDIEISGTLFTLKPKSGAWTRGSFTGSDTCRIFEFDTKGSATPTADWVSALEAHMEYAMKVKLAMLAKVPLVKRLPNDCHLKMASCCVAVDFAAGQTVVRQGDVGEDFYIIVKGECSVSICTKDAKGKDEEKVVATLIAGDYFGETALRRSEPRAATVIALTKLETFQIRRQRFEELGLNSQLTFPNRKAVGMGNAKAKVAAAPTPKSPEDAELISNALHNNRFLQTLTHLNEYKVKDLVMHARKEDVAPGTVLINEGDLNGDSFYIVAEGNFQVIIATQGEESSKKSMARGLGAGGEATDKIFIGPGGSFGELALLYLEPRAATVKSVEKSVVWVIDRQCFKEVLMAVSDEKIEEYIEHLKEVNNLACLLDDERKQLAKSLVEVQFSKDDLIVEQGEHGSTFYILYEGDVAVLKNGKNVKTLSAGVEQGMAQYFGEAALLDNEVRAATVKVVSAEAKALAIDRDTFDGVLGPLKDIMDRTRKEGGGRKLWPGRAKIQAIVALKRAGAGDSRKREKILQADLKKVGLLGCGGFGIVELVEDKSGETYALKGLSKGFVVKAGMQKNVMNEKEIQINLSSAFIVKLFETYSSEQKLFFLLEPALGGELYATYMRKGFHGSVAHAQFYVAGTVFAFEHLHNRSIVYRDLKPENLLLTEKGNVKLTDMGLAKYVTGKTHTSCGTPDYFAPEIIKSSGHNKAVDWWELGILVFELMTGHPPFESADPMETYAKVCNGIERVNFPLNCKGVVGDLVKQLCKKQPSERLPMRAGGTKNVKQHPWFISTKFDWESMRLLSATVPYKPEVKSKKDLQNFPDSAPNMPRMLEYKDDGSGWDKTFATV